jgi:hypothetical protein
MSLRIYINYTLNLAQEKHQPYLPDNATYSISYNLLIFSNVI